MDKKCFGLYIKNNLMMVIEAEDAKDAYNFLISKADDEYEFSILYNKIYHLDVVSDPYYAAVEDDVFISFTYNGRSDKDGKESRLKFCKTCIIKDIPIPFLSKDI
jgi:hypothetical protein